LLYMPSLLPGVSITEATAVAQQTNELILTVPEVKHALAKVGRARTPLDPAPLSMLETTIILKPEKEWRPGMTMEKLTRELDSLIYFPGVTNAWTMPIKTRIDMLFAGIKTPVGIKLTGAKLEVLQQLGEQLEPIVRNLPGTRSVYAERVAGGYYLSFVIKRKEAARYVLTVDDVLDVIRTGIGGHNITTTIEGLERYPVDVRYARELRDNPEALRRVLIATPTGAQVPIGQVADIFPRMGLFGQTPRAVLKRENILSRNILNLEYSYRRRDQWPSPISTGLHEDAGRACGLTCPGYECSWQPLPCRGCLLRFPTSLRGPPGPAVCRLPLATG
jgi:Cu(I)/Ag(I) efflux system membrane protein CusA/SilA